MMKKAHVQWFEIDNPSGRKRKAPAWSRRVAVRDERLFVPAVLGGNEMMVMLCLGYDATPCIVDDGHLYAPADWMAREFPKAREVIAKIRRRIEEAA